MFHCVSSLESRCEYDMQLPRGLHGPVCYLNLISTLGSDCSQLLITYNKPHRAASSTTIWPCLEAFMTKSGIDIELFGTYSTRAAAVASASGKKSISR